MNKKTLFLILLVVLVLPTMAYAITAGEMAGNVRTAALAVGIPVVVIGWVIAGILYLTSAGGSQMQVAKQALIACVIGTVLVILAATACTFINTLFGLGGSCA